MPLNWGRAQGADCQQSTAGLGQGAANVAGLSNQAGQSWRGPWTFVALALSAGLLSQCKPVPQSYPPPLQRNFNPDAEPPAVGEAISMMSPEADNYILSGTITNEPGVKWRWCAPRLEMRFQLASTRGLTYFMDFVLNENTFAQTGPVKFRFLIDGKSLGEVLYDTPGEKHFETPVPPELLRTDRPVVVTTEVDKYLVSQSDQAKLAFLLISAGFKP
ncbi:MAG: hypothetical protein NZV14_19925 [Bryobacteraceae bacterium]|nr:hypothetical protein [Bryobacteraceae bacterium]MDW8380434.1 hypothetical protein [Bryobacterales bacterium]